jgi:O-succinylbenzoic acid--CoA ligase
VERGELAAILGAPFAPHAGESSLVLDAAPQAFMESVKRAVGGGSEVFLGNPGWTERERKEAATVAAGGPSGNRGWLMIPTGGSSGKIKFARHDAATISAAVAGFRAHFGIERVNSVCVLPLHHVAGFMAWMRSAISGGSFQLLAWKDLESGRLAPDVPENACLSLVPTQLQRLISSESAVAWLRRFKVVSIGGGPSWDALIERAAALSIPLSPGYGATETAAMAAAVTPAEFLDGMRGCGRVLPHASISLDSGAVVVSGASVFRGYYPDQDDSHRWTSRDVGTIDSRGSLHIRGRSDDVITTGGEKVSPADVEDALRASGQFEDIAVLGVPDPVWGHAVVACFPAEMPPVSARLLEAALSGLASFKRPKWYVPVSPWPRNAMGKIDRSELARLALVSPRLSSPRAS